jgi:hypothetical protein
MTKPTVFISYSHKDEEWKDRLVIHLGVLSHQGLLDLWDDRRIGAGEDWYQEIHEAMNAASVAVLLISPAYLASEFLLSHRGVPPTGAPGTGRLTHIPGYRQTVCLAWNSLACSNAGQTTRWSASIN